MLKKLLYNLLNMVHNSETCTNRENTVQSHSTGLPLPFVTKVFGLVEYEGHACLRGRTFHLLANWAPVGFQLANFSSNGTKIVSSCLDTNRILFILLNVVKLKIQSCMITTRSGWWNLVSKNWYLVNCNKSISNEKFHVNNNNYM